MNLKYSSIGIFAALSVLAREKFNKELIFIAFELEEICNKYPRIRYSLNNLYSEYFALYKNTSDLSINKDNFEEIINKFKITRHFLKDYFSLLVDLAGRNNELNMDYLHNKLINMNQNQIDSLWTITINNTSDFPKLVHIIEFINKDKIIKFDKLKYANLLVWVFTSTNRWLRDKASKALIRLIINDFNLMFYLLERFEKCNDLYVIERLLCCIYGATMLSEDFNGSEQVALCLYDKVFNKEYIVPDIIIRDHSNCIIDIISQKIPLNVDLSIIKPPYKNNINIKTYDIKDLLSFYKDDSMSSGRFKLLFSISPDLHDEHKLFSMYGDFGRYMFEARLQGFKVNKLDVFYYALHYIKNKLKYDENLFGEYDINNSNYDRHNHKIERIGKKYEWLAMYHTLAIVSDNYSYGDYELQEYHGSWNNYCREFDPSILIDSVKRIYSLIHLPHETKEKWSETKDCGLEFICEDIDELNKDIFGEWVTLYDAKSFYSSKDYNKSRQSYSDITRAYFVPNDKADIIIDNFKNISQLPEGDSMIYQLYLGEYFSSPAYIDCSTEGDSFIEYVIKKEKSIESLPNVDINTGKIEYVMKEMVKPIKERITDIVVAYSKYTWESEYDYSKDGVYVINLPCKKIVDYFHLKQKKPGIWFDGEKIVCVDFALVENTNCTGVRIKKDYLLNYLNNTNQTIIVDSYLERRYSKDGWYNKQKVASRRVIFYLKDGELKRKVYTVDDYSSF